MRLSIQPAEAPVKEQSLRCRSLTNFIVLIKKTSALFISVVNGSGVP